nr:MAG TPA: hypothetical protein [Caudoviricetes sp.]
MRIAFLIQYNVCACVYISRKNIRYAHIVM